ncbi:MAG: HAMP domain-containing protein [Aquabacterium sp.]|uniref:HAMP domain-containing sensor histidine kinase n=1 Tax=Aquabacterium sp. TaxID=1872578 RepID=UPI0011FE5E79|nr:ATP-binding protein [Aquabacterium sp.]TAK87877.1 MAG: HAMP domain-containing protein [Aquabacterium sp.]
MSLKFWHNRGITVRLLTIAVLPASLMFIAVAVAMYATAINDVRRDVTERGRLIATALAQSSQYGLVSGNLSYVRNTLQQLVASDSSVNCIHLDDDRHRTVASSCQAAQSSDQTPIEAPVHIESLPELDLLDPASSGTQLAETSQQAHPAHPMRTIGYVRVTMSASPIFEARRGALLLAFALVGSAAIGSCMLGLRLTRRLRQTMASVMVALRAIRKGQFDVQLDTTLPDELGELQRTILQMAAALDAARHDLEQKVRSRTHELRLAVDQLRQADAEKRRLITHSNALIEEDRKRVAVEIHDHLGASLISVKLEAAALAAKAQASGDEDMASNAHRIQRTIELIYASTRDIVKSLRPEVIDTLGLSMALEDMVLGLDNVHPACRFSFTAAPGMPDLRGEFAMQAYRVVQEALTNIIKHAGATLASVNLSLNEQGDQLCIEIKDNGKGFNTRTSTQSGLGLIGMRERVASVGGEICISSPHGQGTSIHLTLPINRRGDK